MAQEKSSQHLVFLAYSTGTCGDAQSHSVLPPPTPSAPSFYHSPPGAFQALPLSSKALEWGYLLHQGQMGQGGPSNPEEYPWVAVMRRGNGIRKFHREVPEQQVRGSPCQSASQRIPSSPRAREAAAEEHHFNHGVGFPRKPLPSKSAQELEQS